MLDSSSPDPLIALLRDVEGLNGPEFWSFQKSGVRRGAHALLHYPAMMVPDLQRSILTQILKAVPKTKTVLDPFVGSGTVLVESMQLGLDFCGVDINPLAGLACLVKAGPYYVSAFHDKQQGLISAIVADLKDYRPRSFPGREKWFSPQISMALEKIHFHVQAEPALWARRLFWLALCRVVRSVSNSRISTYKLHKRSEVDLCSERDPVVHLKDTLSSFSKHLIYQHDMLMDLGVIKKGHYVGSLDVNISDNSILAGPKFKEKLFDVIMTSPPYGDNRTTIPYGQFAYLPLHWVDLNDIQKNMGGTLLSNTHATDSASLGGSLRHAKDKVEELLVVCKSARDFIEKIKANEYGIKRFGAFFYDLMKSIERISDRTSDGGYHVWTIGNRRIGGHLVPMDDLIAEILQSQGVVMLGTIKRDIHSKKMARRNKSTDTMTTETIVLARKERGV